MKFTYWKAEEMGASIGRFAICLHKLGFIKKDSVKLALVSSRAIVYAYFNRANKD